MWDTLGPAAWVIAAIVFLWMVWDFFVTNTKHSEDFLVSSREGLDEFLPTEPSSTSRKKK
jgi:hypothetical protein